MFSLPVLLAGILTFRHVPMKKPLYIRWILIAVLYFYASVAVQAAGLVEEQSAAQSFQNEAYILGSGDKIRITVYGEDDLSGVYGISAQGTVSFPLLGEVKAEGLNLPELEKTIVTGLKDGFLVSPSVAMEMESYRPFYIMGEVRDPGSYDYVANMSILNAVALAGGFTYRANRNNVDIVRKGRGKEIALEDIDVESVVVPGDIITIRERFF